MSPWTLCLLVVLAVAMVPFSSVAAGPLASPALQALAAAPAAAVINPNDWLVCNSCGRFNGLIGAILLAVYNLLLALLGNVNAALCYTLYIVYIILCIIQVMVSNEISIACYALFIIIKRLLGISELFGLLQIIGKLLSGLLGCLLNILGVALPI